MKLKSHTISRNISFNRYYETKLAETVIKETLPDKNAQLYYDKVKDSFKLSSDNLLLSAKEENGKKILQADVYFGKVIGEPAMILIQNAKETAFAFTKRLFDNISQH